MTAREDGSDKKKQLMIMLGREVRERFTEKTARTGFEETRVTDLWASYSKGPIHSVFIHSMYLSSTCCGSGHLLGWGWWAGDVPGGTVQKAPWTWKPEAPACEPWLRKL